MERYPKTVPKPIDLLEEMKRMGGTWGVGGNLEGILSEMDAQHKIDWAQAFVDGMFIPSKKGDFEGFSQKGAK